MQIVEGDVELLARAAGWRAKQIHKKSNHWLYCPSCITMHCFRVFKCRWDLTTPVRCDCGETLLKPPAKLHARAVAARPHYGTAPASKPAGRDWHAWYYGTYLKGELWKEIRGRVLARDGHACRACNSPAVIVHHESYSAHVLAGHGDAFLVSLCFDCHHAVHFDAGGVRVPMARRRTTTDCTRYPENRGPGKARRLPRGIVGTKKATRMLRDKAVTAENKARALASIEYHKAAAK